MINNIINIAKKCGAIIKSAHASDIEIKKENPKNLVTEYDTKVQSILNEELLKILPEASFLGEEGVQNYSKHGYCFVCDPIDGTTNFVKNVRHSAVSIALLKDGVPILGVIYDPYLDEVYYAQKGKGAFCNGNQICTSTEPLSNSLIVFGTSPYNKTLQTKTWKLAAKSLEHSLDVRRMGAAVLDFAAVACGTYGAYWELELQPWDFAAGVLIAREAGAIVKTIEGEDIASFFEPTSILVTANSICLYDFVEHIYKKI